ncbi:YxeA family protein [Salibacterium aidingense]|uniref:YxeA family protein n=1 Tax=Salibacterium aidingense TaxID=384933 RepID=UPI003BD414AC
MKKVIIIFLSGFVLFIGAIIALANINFNRIGTDQLYVQTSEPVEIDEHTQDSGEIARTYWYETTAYNENGNEETVEYSSTSELSLDAYLMLYVRNGNDVTSFNEVSWKDVPEAAKEELES